MVNVLRRFSQPIMVVITVLVIISFAYWGPGLTRGKQGDQVAFTVFGESIKMDALQRQGRRVEVFADLKGEYIQTIAPMVLMGYSWDSSAIAASFVLEHEADAFGITATDEERIEELNRMRRFRGPDGTFDPALFDGFKQRLNAMGFSDSDFDHIFLNGEVRARKLRELVGSTIAATPEEVREQIMQMGMKTEASYIAFRRETFRKDLKVTDEELKKRYEELKDSLKTPEQRKVRYAAWVLPDPADGKPFEPKVRTEKLQLLANAAYAFRQELEKTKGNFDELAKKHGGTVGETKEFFDSSAPPAELEGSDQIAEAAFKLTKEKPYTDHLLLQKGAYVLMLGEIKPPEQKTFEAAKKDLETEILDNRADELARAKATELRPKLEELTKAGKTFTEAATALELKAEPFPSFSEAQLRFPGSLKNEFADTVPAAAAKLAPGQFSDVLRTPAGNAALLVHLDYRAGAKDEEIAARREFAVRSIETQKRSAVFRNWFVERLKAAGLNRKQEG